MTGWLVWRQISRSFMFFWGAYASVAWGACDALIRLEKPLSSYEELPGGIVRDVNTGLAWQKCSVGLEGSDCSIGKLKEFNWSEALIFANQNTWNGYADWRLPNAKELASLVEKACYLPAVNNQMFPATASSSYWTSTPAATNAAEAWIVDFAKGYSFSAAKTEMAYIRLVRGGY